MNENSNATPTEEFGKCLQMASDDTGGLVPATTQQQKCIYQEIIVHVGCWMTVILFCSLCSHNTESNMFFRHTYVWENNVMTWTMYVWCDHFYVSILTVVLPPSLYLVCPFRFLSRQYIFFRRTKQPQTSIFKFLYRSDLFENKRYTRAKATGQLWLKYNALIGAYCSAFLNSRPQQS